MLRWFAYVLLIVASGAGVVLIVQVITGRASRESRTVLGSLLIGGVIVGAALLYLVRLFPVLAF